MAVPGLPTLVTGGLPFGCVVCVRGTHQSCSLTLEELGPLFPQRSGPGDNLALAGAAPPPTTTSSYRAVPPQGHRAPSLICPTGDPTLGQTCVGQTDGRGLPDRGTWGLCRGWGALGGGGRQGRGLRRDFWPHAPCSGRKCFISPPCVAPPGGSPRSSRCRTSQVHGAPTTRALSSAVSPLGPCKCCALCVDTMPSPPWTAGVPL